ncbi:MAG: serine/threonine protein kinase [Spirulina sp. SIO3F2]|nr:serine/threonine protein kinase [Spirulina sp. SIO3F2]
MEILCTRPTCGASNQFADLDDPKSLKTAQQKYCTHCGMPMILGGRYIPVHLLGKGGFGAAYLARDRYTTSLRECVVKQFLPAGDLTPEQLDIAQGLFEREAHVLEEIGNEHKQIPDSYAFFPLIARDRQTHQDKQFFYLVQEYINGQDLEQELNEQGFFTEAEIVTVMRNVLRILTFVHSRGVIHRDIKPSNIMRSQQGRLYLLDFGAVKQVATVAGSPQGRSTGIYSVGFAPPEQMQGSRVFPSTDLYALAATCLMLLTNQTPDSLFDAYHNEWTWRKHATHVSDGLAKILDRMLLSAPRDRYQSAQEVLQDLNQIQVAATTKGRSAKPTATPLNTTTIQSTPGAAAQPKASPNFQPQAKPQPQPKPAPAKRATPMPATTMVSTVDVLKNAAFTGFEGSLLLMACLSMGGPMLIIWGMSMGLLIYLQIQRTLAQWDLVILGGVTLGLVGLIPFFHSAAVLAGLLQTLSLGSLLGIGFLGMLSGAMAVMVTALFRLVYQILSGIL